MADDRIEIEITLDSGKVVKGLGRVEKTAKKSGKKIGKNLERGIKGGPLRAIKSIGKQIFSLRAGFVALGGALVAALSVRKVIEAAKVQEDAINRLNVALKASGSFTKQASQDFQNFASDIQKVSKFGDELILENAALIQSLGGLSVEGLKPATQAAIDMSAALGIDLRAAATLVGKAATGEISSFTRYGLVIKKGKDAAETFSNALTSLNEKFGGAAAAQVNTFSGATEQLSNTFGDLLEVIGDLIIKNPIILKVIKGLNGFFLGLQKTVKDNKKEFKEFIADVTLGLVKGFASIISAVQPVVNSINNIRVAVLKTRKAINELILKNEELTASSKDSVFNVFGSFDDQVKKAEANIIGLTGEIGEIDVELKRLKENIESNDTVFQPIVDQALALRDKLNMVKAQIKSGISGDAGGDAAPDTPTDKPEDDIFGFGDTKGFLDELEKDVKSGVDSIEKTIKAGLVTGVSQTMQSFGALLAGGSGAFDNFKNVILGIMGDVLIQIGTGIIAAGQAIEALTNAIRLGLGSFAIVGGLALIAIGGALKAKAGGAAAAPVGGGGISAPGNDNFVPVGDEEPVFEEELQEKKPSVNLTIQGNVLDRRETGLEIAEVINEVFGANGIEVNV